MPLIHISVLLSNRFQENLQQPDIVKQLVTWKKYTDLKEAGT